MTPEQILWALGQLIVLISIGVKAYFALTQRMSKAEGDIRVIVTVLGKKAAAVLHSPDDHHGLDTLLTKYEAGQITDIERGQFVTMLLAFENDISASKNERFLASIVLLAIQCESRGPNCVTYGEALDKARK